MDDDFKAAVREWRKRHGLRQKEAADWLGVNLRTYQGYEYGRHQPNQTCIHCLMAKMNQKDESK